MKLSVLSYVPLLFIFLAGCQNTSTTTHEEKKSDSIQAAQAPRPAVKLSDSLETFCFEPFIGETDNPKEEQFPHFKNQNGGFNLYSLDADAQLSWDNGLSGKNPGKKLSVKFKLPALQDKENWLSLRRPFRTVNLEGYAGIKVLFKLKFSSPKGIFRITLADLSDPGSNNDELWWYDVSVPGNKPIGKNSPKTGLTEVLIPFSSFSQAYGYDSRSNNGKFDLDKIIAFEINIITQTGKSCEGNLAVASICTYKE